MSLEQPGIVPLLKNQEKTLFTSHIYIYIYIYIYYRFANVDIQLLKFVMLISLIYLF
jgi:hypothetical protein